MVKKKNKVVIVEDHRLFREGLKGLLSETPTLKSQEQPQTEWRRSGVSGAPAGPAVTGYLPAENEMCWKVT